MLKMVLLFFGYYVNDPERFGVMEFDIRWNILSVEEKIIIQGATTALQDNIVIRKETRCKDFCT